VAESKWNCIGRCIVVGSRNLAEPCSAGQCWMIFSHLKQWVSCTVNNYVFSKGSFSEATFTYEFINIRMLNDPFCAMQWEEAAVGWCASRHRVRSSVPYSVSIVPYCQYTVTCLDASCQFQHFILGHWYQGIIHWQQKVVQMCVHFHWPTRHYI